MAQAAIHGFLLAFGLILPLGVQNVFVFNQGALHPTYRRALPIVLTASLCDTLLISLSVLGVSVLVLASAWAKLVLMGGGVAFLIYMGYATWKNSATEGQASGKQGESFPPRRQIAFGLFVSLLNPHAILDTVGVIWTSSLGYSGTDKLAFAASCILVSWIWFFGLALAGRTAGRLDRSGRFMAVLNKASALVMWAAAAYMAKQLVMG